MSRSSVSSVTVLVGDGVVTLRRWGRSEPTMANILGMEKDAEGIPQRIWLDRLVHTTAESSFTGWDVSGAISTLLTRQPEPASA